MSVITVSRPAWTRWRERAGKLPVLPVLLGVVAAVLVGYILIVVPTSRSVSVANATFPQSAALEEATGVRFSRVAVVGDGGLVMVEYVVLDVEKATAFQTDLPHVPVLTSEAREGGTHRVSIMKPGHLVRAGQTYYFVYQNTGQAIRPGEPITLRYRSHELHHIPVV